MPATTSSQAPTASTIRTRRRRFLTQHPSYLTSASEELEISHPIFYDKWVRRWQSAEGRQREGQSRGVVGALERGVARGEAAAAARAEEDKAGKREGVGSHNPRAGQRIEPGAKVLSTPLDQEGARGESRGAEGVESRADGGGGTGKLNRHQTDESDDTDLEVLSDEFEDDEENGREVTTKAGGLRRWHAFIRHRFLTGKDEDFDYTLVDTNDAYDDIDDQRQQAEDVWFGDESAEFVLDGKGRVEGETGVQDF
nr:hypothetical protein B0A51_01984 [Rachicladosporium sp. CCFEE 5018]